MITRIKRCPARPKLPNIKKMFMVKILSQSNKIEEIIKNIKHENIKELSVQRTYIEDSIVVCIVRIMVDKGEVIPVEVFRELNKKLTEEDENYLELIIRRLEFE